MPKPPEGFWAAAPEGVAPKRLATAYDA